MATREHFFEFHWWYFLGLMALIIGAWRSDGPWLVIGSLALAGLIAGVWFPFWRRNQNRAR